MISARLGMVFLLGCLGVVGCNAKNTVKKPQAGASFELAVEPPPPGAPGAELAATVRVEPRGGYKINLEYPSKLMVKGPPGATPREVKLTVKQAKMTEKVLQFKPAFRLETAGSHAFQGTIRFSVCTEKQCEIKAEKVAWSVKVN